MLDVGGDEAGLILSTNKCPDLIVTPRIGTRYGRRSMWLYALSDWISEQGKTGGNRIDIGCGFAGKRPSPALNDQHLSRRPPSSALVVPRPSAYPTPPLDDVGQPSGEDAGPHQPARLVRKGGKPGPFTLPWPASVVAHPALKSRLARQFIC
jgi:hypothetical protein